MTKREDETKEKHQGGLKKDEGKSKGQTGVWLTRQSRAAAPHIHYLCYSKDRAVSSTTNSRDEKKQEVGLINAV